MYNQVGVNPKQWNLQRIFWRESPDAVLKEYVLTVVTFGLASSAHCAVRAMVQGANDYANHYPEAAKTIKNSFYMDDGIFGAENVQEASILCREVLFVLSQGGFVLKRWEFNSREVEEAMNATHTQETILGKEDDTKILGIRWHKDADELAVFVKRLDIKENPTKCEIFSSIAKLYDPNGYVAAVVINAKIMMQDIWREKEILWNSKVPERMARKWKDFQSTLPVLNDFRIPRWIRTAKENSLQIHGFCYASNKAYGITIYARITDQKGEIHSNLIMAESRVAPIKTLTTPRLELLAAVMLSKKIKCLIETCEFSNASVYLWSDSIIVLYWIKKAGHELKQCVGNRVEIILQNTREHAWSHVESHDNPADLVSRGIEAKKLLNNKLWCEGPSWLKQTQTSWPQTKMSTSPEMLEEVKKEIKTNKGVQVVFALKASDQKRLLYEQFSSWDKVINVTAYTFRFMYNISPAIRRRQAKEQQFGNHLTREERANAIFVWIRHEQDKAYSKEIASIKAKDTLPPKSAIASLHPILDSNGLLRVGGRIDKANISYEKKHPFIVPNGSRLAHLIISHAHQTCFHGGAQLTMRFIRNMYWIPKLRNQIRLYINRCVSCTRQAGVVHKQIMASLPPVRLRPASPFQSVGVDMAGPFGMRITDKVNMNTRLRTQLPEIKAWVAVFVCLVTRAVHLEATEGMSTDDFLQAYQRFVSRRGNPEAVYSDNGTNFVGAANEMQEAFKIWQNEPIQHFVHANNTEWHFIRPCAPHEGGIWEAAVKAMKFHMKRVIGTQKYSIQGMNTLLASIEACLNSRPLCALSENPNDRQALTPAHFLIGRSLKLPIHRWNPHRHPRNSC